MEKSEGDLALGSFFTVRFLLGIILTRSNWMIIMIVNKQKSGLKTRSYYNQRSPRFILKTIYFCL